MSTIKTKVTDNDVEAFIAGLDNPQRRSDALELLTLFTKVTGEPPKMWGTSIIGFGQYHYKSERSRQEGDWMLTGFSPRKQSLSLYLMPGFGAYGELLGRLGKHKIGKGCLYINQLSDVDMTILEELIAQTYTDMRRQHLGAV